MISTDPAPTTRISDSGAIPTRMLQIRAEISGLRVFAVILITSVEFTADIFRHFSTFGGLSGPAPGNAARNVSSSVVAQSCRETSFITV